MTLEAVDVYGPISEWVVGPQGGFRRACFGTTVFSSSELAHGFDTANLDAGLVTIEDPDLEWPCPQCGAKPGHRCAGATKHRVRRAHGEEHSRLTAQVSELRDIVQRLQQQNARLDEYATALRREQRKKVPICNRPTRAGKPCQADAITYPIPIESCRIHLTDEEKAAIAGAEAERRAEFDARVTQPGPAAQLTADSNPAG